MDSLFGKYAYAIVSIAKDENKCLEYKKACLSLSSKLLANQEISKYNDRGIVLYDFVTESNMKAFFKEVL